MREDKLEGELPEPQCVDVFFYDTSTSTWVDGAVLVAVFFRALDGKFTVGLMSRDRFAHVEQEGFKGHHQELVGCAPGGPCAACVHP